MKAINHYIIKSTVKIFNILLSLSLIITPYSANIIAVKQSAVVAVTPTYGKFLAPKSIITTIDTVDYIFSSLPKSISDLWNSSFNNINFSSIYPLKTTELAITIRNDDVLKNLIRIDDERLIVNDVLKKAPSDVLELELTLASRNKFVASQLYKFTSKKSKAYLKIEELFFKLDYLKNIQSSDEKIKTVSWYINQLDRTSKNFDKQLKMFLRVLNKDELRDVLKQSNLSNLFDKHKSLSNSNYSSIMNSIYVYLSSIEEFSVLKLIFQSNKINSSRAISLKKIRKEVESFRYKINRTYFKPVKLDTIDKNIATFFYEKQNLEELPFCKIKNNELVFIKKDITFQNFSEFISIEMIMKLNNVKNIAHARTIRTFIIQQFRNTKKQHDLSKKKTDIYYQIFKANYTKQKITPTSAYYPKDHSFRQLGFVAMFTLAYSALEYFIGKQVYGSQTLAADAYHMLSDSIGLIGASISIWLTHSIEKGKTPIILKKLNFKNWIYFSYNGNSIFQLFSSMFISGLMLLASVDIVNQAIKRFTVPHEVVSGPVIIISFMGLIVNLICFGILDNKSLSDFPLFGRFFLKEPEMTKQTSQKESNISLWAVKLHFLGDIVGSIIAFGSGIVIIFSGFVLIDSIGSLIIATWLLISGIVIIVQLYPLKSITTYLNKFINNINLLGNWVSSQFRKLYRTANHSFIFFKNKFIYIPQVIMLTLILFALTENSPSTSVNLEPAISSNFNQTKASNALINPSLSQNEIKKLRNSQNIYLDTLNQHTSKLLKKKKELQGFIQNKIEILEVLQKTPLIPNQDNIILSTHTTYEKNSVQIHEKFPSGFKTTGNLVSIKMKEMLNYFNSNKEINYILKENLPSFDLKTFNRKLIQGELENDEYTIWDEAFILALQKEINNILSSAKINLKIPEDGDLAKQTINAMQLINMLKTISNLNVLINSADKESDEIKNKISFLTEIQHLINDSASEHILELDMLQNNKDLFNTERKTIRERSSFPYNLTVFSSSITKEIIKLLNQAKNLGIKISLLHDLSIPKKEFLNTIYELYGVDLTSYIDVKEATDNFYRIKIRRIFEKST